MKKFKPLNLRRSHAARKAVLVLILLSTFPAQASTRTNFIIGMEEIKPSADAVENDDNYARYFRDLLAHFAATKGYKFEFKVFPIARLLASFLKGEVDFKCPDNQDWSPDLKKGKKISYSDTLEVAVEGTMVKPENASLGLDKFHLLGSPIGFTPVPYEELIRSGKVVSKGNASISGLMKQAIAGRIDGAYYNVNSAKEVLEKIGMTGQLVFSHKLPRTRVSYSVSTIRYADVIEEFNRFMKEHAALVAELKHKNKLKEPPGL